MSDLLKKIELLERDLAQLTEERRFTMSTLEMAASLLAFDTIPIEQMETGQILEETACKIFSMLNFEALCFYLINEEDASFEPAYTEPEEIAESLVNRVDQLIEDQTFAWALGRNKPVRVAGQGDSPPILLHSIATSSSTYGMFVGIPLEGIDDYEFPLPLLSLVLHSCANIIGSAQLYRQLREANRKLQQQLQLLQEQAISPG